MNLTIVRTFGGRPKTNAVAFQTLDLVLQKTEGLDLTVVHVRWDHPDASDYESDKYPYRSVVLKRPMFAQAACANEALAYLDYTPDYLVVMDDDIVIGERTLPNMLSIMETDTSIGLLGAWNDLSERRRGTTRWVWNEEVQYGNDFCAGGGFMMLRGKAIDALRDLNGGPSSGNTGCPFREELRRIDEYTNYDLRFLQYNVCLARTVGVAHLPDDGQDPNYRANILSMHYANKRLES